MSKVRIYTSDGHIHVHECDLEACDWIYKTLEDDAMKWFSFQSGGKTEWFNKAQVCRVSIKPAQEHIELAELEDAE